MLKIWLHLLIIVFQNIVFRYYVQIEPSVLDPLNILFLVCTLLSFRFCLALQWIMLSIDIQFATERIVFLLLVILSDPTV